MKRSSIGAAVEEAYGQFVKQGFVFKLNKFEENHNAARLTWDMVPAAGGEAVAIGTQYWIRGADGRIRTDHQFVEKAQ